MKAAPIIHTRTYSCDFNSEFRVRPDVFMSSDITWARKIVLDATREIDGLKGERWLVADNGKYRMAGVVGFLRNICNKSNLDDIKKDSYKYMFCDNKGRSVYAFIGVVINLQENNYFSVNYDYLWNIYTKYISPVWKSTSQNVITESFSEIDSEDDKTYMPEIEGINVLNKLMFESNMTTDYQLFKFYLKDSSKTNYSFCSNLSDINAVKQCSFSIVTTSINNITRLKRPVLTEPVPVVNAPVSENMQENNTIENNIREEENDYNKKKLSVLCVSFLLILIIIILMCILLVNSVNAAGLSTLTQIQEVDNLITKAVINTL